MKFSEAILANSEFRLRSQVEGNTGKKMSLAALSTANNLTVIENLLRKNSPAKTLEIGLCFAGSGLLMSAFHADCGAPDNHSHIAIDPFQSTVWDGVGETRIQELGLQPWFECIEDFSHLALPYIMNRGDRFDLIYVDGSHIFEDVFVDMYYCIRLLNDGGIIIFDDATDIHVRKVLNFVRKNVSALEEIDLSEFHPKGQSFQYKLARLAGKLQMAGFERKGDPTRSWDARCIDF